MLKLSNLLAIFLASAMVLAFSQTAQSTSTEKKSNVKIKKTKKINKKIVLPTASTALSLHNEVEPDVSLSDHQSYKCELGNSVDLYSQLNNDQVVDMKWKNKIYRLNRVSTSTGAQRFENEKAGLVWINIPSKGLLLDSNKGRQLANECKSSRIS